MPKKLTSNETNKELKEKNSKKADKTESSMAKATSRKQIKKSSETFDDLNDTNDTDNISNPRTFKIHKLTLIFVFLIIVAGLLMYLGRGYIIAAVVNGQPISRLELVKESEKASGKQAMASLVRNILVEQEARKKNINISDKEINDQIKKVEGNLSKQGQKLDQMLTLEGLTRDDLRKMIRLDLLITKLIGKDVKITDKEINDYIETNKDYLPKGKSEKELKKDAEEALKRQKLPQKAQSWFADLEKKANIVKFVNY